MALPLLPHDGQHGWTPYAWLIYTVPYCAFPFVAGASVWEWVGHAAGYVAFLALYFRGYWVEGTERLGIIIAITTLSVPLTALNPGALNFYVFAAAFVPGARAGRQAVGWIVAVSLAAAVAVLLLFDGPWTLAIAGGVALFSMLIGFVNLRTHELQRRDASLKLARDEIARLAALAERERIAGELHDLLGHTLSVIVLKSELAARLITRDPARAADEIRAVECVSREALGEVRRAVRGMRGATIEDELVRARAVLGTARIAVDVESSAPDDQTTPALPPDVDHHVAMILREAVTNVLRHSKAARCAIHLTRGAHELQLYVADNGIGRGIIAGAGIESMRARARDIGATLEHHAGRGVAITLRVPLKGFA